VLLTASVGPGLSAAVASTAATPHAASAPVASAEEEWEEEPGEWEVEDDEEEWEVEEDDGEWEVEVEEEGDSDSGWEVSDERQREDALEPCTPRRANVSIVASERRNAARLKGTSKVRAAKFAVGLDMATPSYCEHHRKRHLTTRRQLGGREPAR